MFCMPIHCRSSQSHCSEPLINVELLFVYLGEHYSSNFGGNGILIWRFNQGTGCYDNTRSPDLNTQIYFIIDISPFFKANTSIVFK